jgi:hypothetical protein
MGRNKFSIVCTNGKYAQNWSIELYEGKGNVLSRTGHEGPDGGVGGQRHAPAALPLGMTRYPLYRRLGRPQGWSGWVLKI